MSDKVSDKVVSNQFVTFLKFHGNVPFDIELM